MAVPHKELLGATWQTLRGRGAAGGAGQCLEEGSWAGHREVRALGRPAAWTSASGPMENRSCVPRELTTFYLPGQLYRVSGFKENLQELHFRCFQPSCTAEYFFVLLLSREMCFLNQKVPSHLGIRILLNQTHLPLQLGCQLLPSVSSERPGTLTAHIRTSFQYFNPHPTIFFSLASSEGVKERETLI